MIFNVHILYIFPQVQYSFIFSFNPFPNDKFYSTKLKEFADDKIKFNENGRKLSKQIENTAGKGEIARYKQFLLFPQCFKRLVQQTRKRWLAFLDIQ